MDVNPLNLGIETGGNVLDGIPNEEDKAENLQVEDSKKLTAEEKVEEVLEEDKVGLLRWSSALDTVGE